MKCSFGISDFLEEISSLSHSVVFLYFLALTGALSAGGCARRAKCGREKPPHVRGQGQKPGGPHARRAAAKRSYPTSEVRGSSRECQAETAQERPRGATPHPRSGAAAGMSYPTPPRPRPGRRPGGPTPRPRSPGCAGAGGPRGAIPRSRSGRVAVRRYPSSKVRSSCEEIPHAQGKRNPSKMTGVARGHQRADTLKPYSQKTSQSNHTRTTALSN